MQTHKKLIQADETQHTDMVHIRQMFFVFGRVHVCEAGRRCVCVPWYCAYCTCSNEECGPAGETLLEACLSVMWANTTVHGGRRDISDPPAISAPQHTHVLTPTCRCQIPRPPRQTMWVVMWGTSSQIKSNWCQGFFFKTQWWSAEGAPFVWTRKKPLKRSLKKLYPPSEAIKHQRRFSLCDNKMMQFYRYPTD